MRERLDLAYLGFLQKGTKPCLISEGIKLFCVSASKTNLGCTTPLGMENGAIHDSRITASSSLDNKHTALQARLHLTADSRTGGGWSALKDDFYQWLQIELGGYTTVTRVATQGGNGRNEWVTKYRLLYSSAGNIFMYYKLRENSSAMVSIHKAQSCSLDLWRFVGFVVNRNCNL